MHPAIIIVPSAFFMVGFIVHTIVDGFRRRQQVKMFTEFHTKLLDRIGSAREFGEFFNSEAGARFLDSLSSSEAGAPQVRILRSLQSGLVMLAVGLGFFILVTVRSYPLEAVDGLLVLATASSAIGGGLLVSTAMSYLMSKRMGLWMRSSDRRDRDVSRSA